MKIRKFLATLLVAMLAIVASAQMPQMTIPADTAIRVGKLDNGLTYYIRHNNWPENRVEYYIAQRVGSIQEEENQRGLAHFLEHMCFNGTKHFPGNEIIKYCESIGVRFGVDLNAYTSIDRTVYNISNIPTTRQAALDSCLLILADWADGLLLEPAEIDKERGVIHEEWRLRTSAQTKMLERNLPTLYPGSKYGLRYPIGLMSVIDNFKPQALRDYYEKWYRPDNQAIIIVGNVDVDYTEKKIKEYFGGIAMPSNPARIKQEPVPDTNAPIVIVDKEKEQTVQFAQIMMKHDAVPDSLRNTMPVMLTNYAINAATKMLNDRLAEAAQEPDAPFVQGQTDYSAYIYAHTKDAMDLIVVPKDGKLKEATAAVYREALRAARFGFTPTEYSRYKADYLSSLDKIYSNKDKRTNEQFVNQYVDNFLENEAMPSIDFTYTTMKQVVPVIPLDAINKIIKELVTETDTNLVVLNYNPDKEGLAIPTKEELLSSIQGVRSETLEAYVDNVKSEPFIATAPKKGSIKKEEKNEKLGYTKLTLSNGAKVILKKTDYKKDQVILNGWADGGKCLYGEADFTNLKAFDDVIGASGLGNFSSTELEKAMAGKIANANLLIGPRQAHIKGASTPTDVETMLQMVYLYFTSINKDQKSFDNLMQQYEVVLKNKAVDPESAFSDSLSMTVNSHNPRTNPLTLDDLKNISYDRILEIAKEQTANAAGFTFNIIGNYDEDTIRPLIMTYLASLPGDDNKKVMTKDISTPVQGKVNNTFKRKMDTPKAISTMYWLSHDVHLSAETDIQSDILGQVLMNIYLRSIREEASAAYTVSSFASVSKNHEVELASLYAYCPMKPEKADLALKIMRAEVEKITSTCDPEAFRKAKEYTKKSHDTSVKTNAYWDNVISVYEQDCIDLHSDFDKTLEAQTPETISAFAKKLVSAGNMAEVTMLPE